MAQILGRDLGVKVEIVELGDLTALPRLLASADVDLGMAGIAVTPERATEPSTRSTAIGCSESKLSNANRAGRSCAMCCTG